ncbi:tripartite motif-containing protein 5-like [Choloepus didactylus]|uniref:tripartite motif-containing protein 5-like n=1 Tax=Choloepus didactylus TaxID=27675 RepID=UPI00189F2CD2|nr:tripartite motif-containing protein 5-like [Choloepus didactylus]
MAAEFLVDIQEEVTCPICLDFLTEPVSTDCGHSFCQACITGNSKQSDISQEGANSCPVCRSSYQPGNLRPNRHLANIVEKLREVSLGPRKEPEFTLCARHGEKLQLFCKEDGMIICWLCERSQEHRRHKTFLVEEAAQMFQEKLQVVLGLLRKKWQEADKFEADIRQETALWKKQIKDDDQHIQAEFTKLIDILQREEQKELQNLKREEKEVLDKLAESENEMVQQSQFVRELISDVEHRLQGSRMELLQDVNGIIKRSESLTLKKPVTFQNKQRSVFRAPDLSELLRVRGELNDAQCYWVHMTLEPIKPNSNIVLSEDRRQVRYAPNWMREQNFYSTSEDITVDLMGSHPITSGKHYWEVDVSQKVTWVLGVFCGRHIEALPNFGFQQYEVYEENDYPTYHPQYGYWVIGLQAQNRYTAFLDSSSSNPSLFTLSLAVRPHRIGVFLDCEAKTVSFFNATNHGFLIYKFSNCHFSNTVYPYFNITTCRGPMSLCSPNL